MVISSGVRWTVLLLSLVACDIPGAFGSNGGLAPGDPPELARSVLYSAEIPATLWRASRDSVPASGNFTFLTSHGPGSVSTALYTDAVSLTRVTHNTATLTVSISGPEPRLGVFVGAFTMTQLLV